MESHSKIAIARKVVDPNFEKNRLAIIALGPDRSSVSLDVVNAMDEWVTVLSCLMHRALASPTLSSIIGADSSVHLCTLFISHTTYL
jgi:hypothetical protein